MYALFEKINKGKKKKKKRNKEKRESSSLDMKVNLSAANRLCNNTI
jgi:hypothetical protein